MSFVDFLLYSNKNSCRLCLKSCVYMFDLNGYDFSINRHMTLLEILELVKKTKDNFKEPILQTAYICFLCKQKLSNAYRVLKNAEKSKHISAPKESCTPEEYITQPFSESEKRDSDHSNNNKEKPLNESDKDSKHDKSCDLIEHIENHVNVTDDLSVTRQSNPIREIMATSNNRDSDSDEIDFDTELLSSSHSRHSTPIREMMAPSNNREPDSEEIHIDPEPLKNAATSSSPQIRHFAPIRELMTPSNNRVPNTEKLEKTSFNPKLLKNATKSSSSQIRHSFPIRELMNPSNNRESNSENLEENAFNPKSLKNSTKSSSQQTLQSTTPAINEDLELDKSELTDDLQRPFKKPRITPSSSLETRTPMSEMMTVSSNTNALPICKYCSRSYATASSLKRHITSLHYDISRDECVTEKTNSDIPCIYCPRIFKRQYTLKRHLNSFHHDEASIRELEGDDIIVSKKKIPRQRVCPYCGRCYSKSSINIHIRRHTGENPYKCNVCEKGFPRRNDLVVHKRNHTGEKPHTCVVCMKSFTAESKLSRHMYLHYSRNRLICDECGKGFCNVGDLKIHLRRHTGERPYNCKVCKRDFISASARSRHRCPGDATQMKENNEPTINTKN